MDLGCKYCVIFSIDNISHYLHPNLVRNLYGYTETNETYIIKKYHKKDINTRKIIDYGRGDKYSLATSNPYWRKTKSKYKHNWKIYLTRKTVGELKQLKASVTIFQ